ncbi:unnamed protein product [Bubo scandiacus]
MGCPNQSPGNRKTPGISPTVCGGNQANAWPLPASGGLCPSVRILLITGKNLLLPPARPAATKLCSRGLSRAVHGLDPPGHLWASQI